MTPAVLSRVNLSRLYRGRDLRALLSGAQRTCVFIDLCGRRDDCAIPHRKPMFAVSRCVNFVHAVSGSTMDACVHPTISNARGHVTCRCALRAASAGGVACFRLSRRSNLALHGADAHSRSGRPRKSSHPSKTQQLPAALFKLSGLLGFL